MTRNEALQTIDTIADQIGDMVDSRFGDLAWLVVKAGENYMVEDAKNPDRISRQVYVLVKTQIHGEAVVIYPHPDEWRDDHERYTLDTILEILDQQCNNGTRKLHDS